MRFKNQAQRRAVMAKMHTYVVGIRDKRAYVHKGMTGVTVQAKNEQQAKRIVYLTNKKMPRLKGTRALPMYRLAVKRID